MFKYDSPLMQAMGEFTDFMVLNILFVICCIPIFTIGAAYSARFYIGMKLVTNTDEGIIKPFFKSFVSNLKQTLPINIVAVLLIVFFAFDFHFIYVLQMSTTFYYVIGAILVLILMTLWFTFALIARYEMETRAVLKSAFLLTISHLLRVLFAVAMSLAPFVLSYWFFTWAWLIWLILETVMLIPNCRFLVKTFDKIEIAQGLKPDPDKETEEESDEEYEKESVDESKAGNVVESEAVIEESINDSSDVVSDEVSATSDDVTEKLSSEENTKSKNNSKSKNETDDKKGKSDKKKNSSKKKKNGKKDSKK